MPYPYEPYDPQLAGVKLPQASQFQAYDPSVYAQQNAAPPGLSGVPSQMPQGFNPDSMADPQAGARAGIMAGLQGSNVGDMGQPIPPEYLQKAQQLQQLMSPGPVEQRFLEANAAVPGNVHGLRAHLAGIGKGLLMGGLGGAVLGGVDPSMVNRAWHRAQLPGMAQAAQYEQQGRHGQLERAKGIEGLTGIDPMTGLKSPSVMNRDYMNALAMGRLGVQQANSASLIDSRKGMAEQRKAKFANVPFENFIKAYNSGALNSDPEALIEMAERAGIPNAESIDPKFLPGMIKTIVDKNFGINTLNLKTNEVKPTGVTSSAATTEANKVTHQKEMESQGRQRISQGAQRLSQQQLKALSDAEEKEVKSIQKPSMFGPDSRPLDEQQSEYKRKIAEVRSKYAAQKQASSGGAKVNDPNVGRTVKGQGGKSGTVVGLNPDGTYRINWK